MADKCIISPELGLLIKSWLKSIYYVPHLEAEPEKTVVKYGHAVSFLALPSLLIYGIGMN